MALFGHFPDPGALFERGFTSTPRAGAPVTPFSGFWGSGWKRAQNPLFWGFWGVPPGNRGFRLPGPGGLSRTPAGYRGAPARGVDVKPPSRGVPGPGPGVSREPLASQDPLRGPGPGPEASGALFRPLEGPPGPPRARVLHQPLAPGPRGCPPGSGGVSRDPGSGEPSRGSRGSPPPRTGARHRTACPGRGGPQGLS